MGNSANQKANLQTLKSLIPIESRKVITENCKCPFITHVFPPLVSDEELQLLF